MQRIAEAVRAAKVPLRLNTQPGDTVALIVDTGSDRQVWTAMQAAAIDLGLDPVVTLMTPRGGHNSEPAALVARVVEEADVSFFLTTKALAHSQARSASARRGHTTVFMEELTVDMLLQAGSEDDYRRMEAVALAVNRMWDEGEDVHIVSAAGTDLRCSVKGRRGFNITGIASPSPFVGGKRCAFPDGECGIAPVEGSAQGVVVVDVSMHGLGWLQEPLRLEIRDGQVVGIKGGAQAAQLEKHLAQHGDEHSRNFPAELSIGLNPALTYTGSVRTDKKVLGGIHLALGASHDIGGTVHSKLHMDAVIDRPTITVDGRRIMDKGALTIA